MISSRGGENPGLDYALVDMGSDIKRGFNEVSVRSEAHSRGATGSQRCLSGTRTHESLQSQPPAACSAERSSLVRHTFEGWVVLNFNGSTRIQLDGLVVEGDCGAAVIDEKTGDLYGHIVRGCSGTALAYIVPATEVFADLRRRSTGQVLLTSLKNRQREGFGAYLQDSSSLWASEDYVMPHLPQLAPRLQLQVRSPRPWARHSPTPTIKCYP